MAETMEPDADDNAVDAPDVAMLNSDANIVVSRDDKPHLIALIGVSDLVVVHTADCTLVCPKSESQRVKELVETGRQAAVRRAVFVMRHLVR